MKNGVKKVQTPGYNVRTNFDLQLKEGLHGSSQHHSLIYIYQMTLRMPLSDVNLTDGLSVFYSDKSIS